MARGSLVTLPPVILIRGDDASLRSAEVRVLIHAAAGDEDLSLGLDDFSSEDYDLAAVVDAAQTPPMFTTRRVVVAREVGRFGAEHVEPMLSYLTGPCPTTTLLLVAGGGTLNRKLVDAIKKVGDIRETGVPTGKARVGWLSERLASAPVRLDGRATNRLAEHLGDDLSRVGGIVAVLAAVHGQGARIGVDELEPFLGTAGSGAPWDLTDAIDRGDIPAALAQLGRNLGAGDRHPLQVMASLQVHFGRMLRLDGSGVRDENEAAAILGMTGSTFPAKKALLQARKLGGENIRRAVRLLAVADMDLRGVRDLPGETVMELLVARLTRLATARR
jgi:DNA polymerase III subunit delta